MGEGEYSVVVNHEEQYSVWSKEMELPAGWREAGFSGPKEDCLAHIESVWSDIRPLSVRKSVAASTAQEG
ncbi:MbtH family protein [Streptomyces sp. NPDC056948]|uniref:MbtH family protein n=1 Tax=Streptomyces sp. NPDC056948 TaxID=3345975 RepID=UPI003632D381